MGDPKPSLAIFKAHVTGQMVQCCHQFDVQFLILCARWQLLLGLSQQGTELPARHANALISILIRLEPTVHELGSTGEPSRLIVLKMERVDVLNMK